MEIPGFRAHSRPARTDLLELLISGLQPWELVPGVYGFLRELADKRRTDARH